jgi:hypothetical protein
LNNIKYIYSNGCSYTEGYGLDNPVKERYSKFLADKFGAEDINQSEGGGSNQRIFRTTYDWISENQDKLKDTLFVLQLSYPVRNEIWVNKANKDDFEHGPGYIAPSFYGGGGIWFGAQFGHDGYTAWEAHERDTSVDKNEINFTYVPGNKSASEITWRYVISLQSFFKSNNIKYIFFEGDINKDGFLDKTCKIAELVDFDYFYEEPFLGSAGNRVTECNHPDAEVQIEWAEKLYNFINTELILI